MKSKKYVFMALVAGLMCLASVAIAQDDSKAPSSQASQKFDLLLKSIDTIPTRAELDQNYVDAQGLLIAGMNDANRTEYERQRALTLLSFYPNGQTRQALTLVFKNDPNDQLRKYALYTLARSFGETADRSLVELVGQGLQDESDDVRKFARLSVKYLKHPAAAQLK